MQLTSGVLAPRLLAYLWRRPFCGTYYYRTASSMGSLMLFCTRLRSGASYRKQLHVYSTARGLTGVLCGWHCWDCWDLAWCGQWALFVTLRKLLGWIKPLEVFLMASLALSSGRCYYMEPRCNQARVGGRRGCGFWEDSRSTLSIREGSGQFIRGGTVFAFIYSLYTFSTPRILCLLGLHDVIDLVTLPVRYSNALLRYKTRFRAECRPCGSLIGAATIVHADVVD